MASPQIENGFTKLANELLEQLALVQMSGAEWQFVMCLVRKTYGYNKKEDWITNSQISLMSGLRKERVSEAKRKLLARNIVTEKRNKISLQKDWEQWKELRKSVSFVTEKRNKSYGKAYTQKKKENITKETSERVDSVRIKSMTNENLIPEVIKLFESVDKKNKTYYSNKTQRDACKFLLDEYGLVEVEKRIAVLPRTNGMQFFPTITTPHQLKEKWVQLENAVTRAKSEQINNNKVAF